ncbi:MAG: LPS export ABC transporter periplasmic protein LptC [Syntrophaceae bacterium]|nr:LPS export ABC transporter periplasmic protein LptC [Syntrophaceae bacterium]
MLKGLFASKVKKRILLVSGVLLVLAAAGIWWFVQNRGSIPKQALQIMAENVDLQVRNVTYTDVGSSGEKWEVKADSARYMRQEKIALFDKVAIKLILADGQTFHLTGDQGRLKTDLKDMEITGNVVILSDRGDRFTTDRLSYVHGEKKIFTRSPVTMENDRMKIRGVGLTLRLDSRDLKLSSRVEAETKPVGATGGNDVKKR